MEFFLPFYKCFLENHLFGELYSTGKLCYKTRYAALCNYTVLNFSKYIWAINYLIKSASWHILSSHHRPQSFKSNNMSMRKTWSLGIREIKINYIANPLYGILSYHHQEQLGSLHKLCFHLGVGRWSKNC